LMPRFKLMTGSSSLGNSLQAALWQPKTHLNSWFWVNFDLNRLYCKLRQDPEVRMITGYPLEQDKIRSILWCAVDISRYFSKPRCSRVRVLCSLYVPFMDFAWNWLQARANRIWYIVWFFWG
jgi:hypothetical protein